MQYKDIYETLTKKVTDTNSKLIALIDSRSQEIDKLLTNYVSERNYVESYGASLGSKSTVDSVKEDFESLINSSLSTKKKIELGKIQNGRATMLLENGSFTLELAQRAGNKEISTGYIIKDTIENVQYTTTVLPNESLLLTLTENNKKKIHLLLNVDSPYFQRIKNDTFIREEEKVDLNLIPLFDTIYNTNSKKDDILDLLKMNDTLSSVQGLDIFIEQQFKLKKVLNTKPRNNNKLTS